MRNSKLSPSIHFAFVRLLVAGSERGLSYPVREMSERLEIAIGTVWKIVRTLVELELIYVKEWRRSGKVWAPCYAWGFKEDSAPKPLRQSDSEYGRTYRLRKKLRNASAMDRIADGLTSSSGPRVAPQ